MTDDRRSLPADAFGIAPAPDDPDSWIVVDHKGNPVRSTLTSPYERRTQAHAHAARLTRQRQRQSAAIDEPKKSSEPKLPSVPSAPLRPEVLLLQAMKTNPKMSVRAKARLLVSAGMEVADAARLIKVRYQQAYRAVQDILDARNVPRCSTCGRPLTDPEHVKNMMGPVCGVKQSMQGRSFKKP